MDKVQPKRDVRSACVADLEAQLGTPTPEDESLLKATVANLHARVAAGLVSPLDVWRSYTRKALECHARTNCLTELISFEDVKGSSKKGPLYGVPISIKDNFGIRGYDASMGFPSRCGRPLKEDSALIRLLRDSGAVLYVKTNVPTGMMSILSSNAVWGTTGNPHDVTRSPGGSSSGEGALIGGGGSRIGIGTDIGGSVRVPAHFCGIYSLRMTGRRFPRAWLEDASTPGFEGIPDVSSPLAKTMEDLTFFVEGVMSMKPWEYCYDLLPIPWRSESRHSRADDTEEQPRRPKINKVGYIRSDGFLEPTPAVERALNLTISALRSAGVDVEEFKLPEPGHVYDRAYASLSLADGFETVAKPLSKGESPDPVVASIRSYAWLPKWVRTIFEWVLSKFWKQSDLADELRQIGPCNTTRYYERVVFREELRREFWNSWKAAGIDILLTPPFPSPAPPVHNYIPDSACNYTAIFNLLDYPAGVIPVTTVDRAMDETPADLDCTKFNWQTQSYYSVYSADEMHGLPVGVQIVGPRFRDEQVLEAMNYIDDLVNPRKAKSGNNTE